MTDKGKQFMDMLHDKIGKDHEVMPILNKMVIMLEPMEEFEDMMEVYTGVQEYGQFLTEKEAKRVVEKMVSYDGTRGAKWPPAILFDSVQLLGGEKAVKGKYNCWALYALMNMMHSDYGDALHEVAKGDDYALTCYRMSLSWMKDKDHPNDVREYFLQ